MLSSVSKFLRRKCRSLSTSSWIVLAYFTCWFFYFILFWTHAIFIDDFGNLWAGHINMWGDWAAHFTMGSAMAYRQFLLTESPFLLGARFSYPFVTNLLAASLIRLGVPFFSAFIIPSFIFSCGLVASLFYFFKTLFQSRKIAILASLIFLLNGGLGFFYFGQDIINSAQPLDTLLNPPHEYTRLDVEHIKWISVIDSMVIPQRAFNLGFPLAVLALALIYENVYRAFKTNYLKLAVAGLILGSLPLIHTHSFLASGIILAFWFVGSFLRLPKWSTATLEPLVTKWGIIAALSLLLAAPLYLYFFFNQTKGFVKWYPGWLAKEFGVNWLLFWFKNWAFTPLLGVVGWVTIWLNSVRSQRWLQIWLWLPFFLLFGLANLFLFQPFSWDNTKLIVWASLGIAGLTGYGLHWLFQAGLKLNGGLKALILTGVIGLFLVTIASGTVDAYWILRTDLHTYQMYSSEEMLLSEWVKNNTSIDSIWLTSDQHNHWLFNLTGRQPVMAYRGWLWTYGYDYRPTEHDIQLMYTQPTDSSLFQKYRVDYVVVGPSEKKTWQASTVGWETNFDLVKSTDNYSIYQSKN